MRIRQLISTIAITALSSLIALSTPAQAATSTTGQVDVHTEHLALDLLNSRSAIGDEHYGFATGQGGDGVTVYIIDSGIDIKSPEFKGKTITGENFVPDGRDWTDCWGHGTAVASLAAGNTLGSAPNSTLVSLRVFACDGTMPNNAVLLDALQWVLDHHKPGTPGVVNLSMGSGANSTIDAKVQLLIDAGLTVVVSAGNKTRDACGYSPARVADAITVGNAAMWDMLTPADSSNYGSCVDLFAPGTDVEVATLSTSPLPYQTGSGTSYAAPLVAGLAARYLSAYPEAAPKTVTDYLIASATPDILSDIRADTANRFAYMTDSDLRAPETVPGPVRVTRVSPYVQCIALDFLDPLYSGTTHPLIGYTFTFTAKGQKTATVDVKVNDFDALMGSAMACSPTIAPGIKYTVSVAGYSALGTGQPTTLGNAFAYDYAAKPANLSATSTSKSTTVVRWSASTSPASLGFAKFVRYEYRTSLDGTAGKKWTAWKSNGSSTSVTLTKLTPGATRLVQVRVVTKAEEYGLTGQVVNKSPK